MFSAIGSPQGFHLLHQPPGIDGTPSPSITRAINPYGYFNYRRKTVSSRPSCLVKVASFSGGIEQEEALTEDTKGAKDSRQLQRSADWKAARAYKESGSIYEGKVEGFNGGGLLIRFYSLLGFHPFPLLSPRHSQKEPQKYIQDIARGLVGSSISVKPSDSHLSQPSDSHFSQPSDSHFEVDSRFFFQWNFSSRSFPFNPFRVKPYHVPLFRDSASVTSALPRLQLFRDSATSGDSALFRDSFQSTSMSQDAASVEEFNLDDVLVGASSGDSDWFPDDESGSETDDDSGCETDAASGCETEASRFSDKEECQIKEVQEVILPNMEEPKMTPGTKYNSVEEFRLVLRQYCVVKEVEVKIVKSGPSRVTAVCADDSCNWRIHASRLRDGMTFQVKTLNDGHSCSSVNKRGNKLAGHRWIASKILSWLKNDPHLTVHTISTRLSEKYHLSLPYHRIWRARELASEQIYGSWDE